MSEPMTEERGFVAASARWGKIAVVGEAYIDSLPTRISVSIGPTMLNLSPSEADWLAEHLDLVRKGWSE